MSRSTSLYVGALVLAGVVWTLGAQQAAEPPQERPLEERVAALEERLASLERSLAPGDTSSLSLGLETRLRRVESRLDRVENTLARPYAGGLPAGNMLESRIRALEREVSRLQR